MHTNEPRKNPLTDLGYETEDLNMKGLFKGMVWFFGFAFFSIFAGAGLYYLMNQEGLKQAAEVTSPFTNKVPAAPNPLLQTNVTVKTDPVEMRRMEENALTTPAYVDQAKGVVRIPIDHAIDLTVERLQNPAAPVVAPGTAANPGLMRTPTGVGQTPAPSPTPAGPATNPAGGHR